MNRQSQKSTSKYKSAWYIMMLTCILLIQIISGCQREKLYRDGDYYGESEGYYSQIKVKVTIKNGLIDHVEIIEHQEPEILATAVFDNLPEKIIKENSTQVDVIAGATYTSTSLLQAVEIALDQSRISE
jgi:uncharacterized protein with FMN-binding domain